MLTRSNEEIKKELPHFSLSRVFCNISSSQKIISDIICKGRSVYQFFKVFLSK